MLTQGLGTKLLDDNTTSYIYHDPNGLVDDESFNQWDGNRIWAKVNPVGEGYRMFIYYTIDSSYLPEGAGGDGINATKTIEIIMKQNTVALEIMSGGLAQICPQIFQLMKVDIK